MFLPLLSFYSAPNHIKDEIVGFWILDEDKSSQESIIYKRVDGFKEDMPGFQFNKNGELLVRQNAGWCGTPPVSYTNRVGKWSIANDSTLELDYEYWGGNIKEEWQITEVSENTLKVKQVSYLRDGDRKRNK